MWDRGVYVGQGWLCAGDAIHPVLRKSRGWISRLEQGWLCGLGGCVGQGWHMWGRGDICGAGVAYVGQGWHMWGRGG